MRYLTSLDAYPYCKTRMKAEVCLPVRMCITLDASLLTKSWHLLSLGHVRPVEPGAGAQVLASVAKLLMPEAWGVATGLLGCSYGGWPLGGGLASSWLLGPGACCSAGLTDGRKPACPAFYRTRSGSGQASHIQTRLHHTKGRDFDIVLQMRGKIFLEPYGDSLEQRSPTGGPRGPKGWRPLELPTELSQVT